MYTIKIKRFNSCLYFYYINNKINPLTIVVNLSKVPLIVVEGQNYIKLFKELCNRIKQRKKHERAMLSKSR